MDKNRLLQLSGLNPQHKTLEELKADRQKVLEAYDRLIQEVEAGQQLDEGLFTSLKATLATVGQLGAAGAKKVADAAKKVADDVKEVYLTQKAKAELELLVKNIKKVITDFEAIEKDASTIIKRDPEVAKEMELFKSLFVKLLDTLQARLAIAKGQGERVEPTA